MELHGDELLVVDGVKKYFPITRGIIFQKAIAQVQAVDGVSFSINPGETLGIVGESGCGKSTLARCIVRLLETTAGRILFEGRDITHVSRAGMRPIRREMTMIFQDPYASLNPRKRVGFIIGEPLEVHKLGTPAEVKTRVQELLEVVGLNPEHYNRFPHEFSGGQRQRIGVARALAVNPKLIVCDEPVSALDVSVQAQILNLLKDLQDDFGLTYVFIAHDLNVVRHISDRVMVMYLGQVSEVAPRDALYREPKHPYTGALLSAVPIPDPERGRARESIVLEGDVPSPVNPPSACRFHPRCPRFVEGHCDVEEPELRPMGPGHVAKCHYPLERWPMTAAEMRRRGSARGARGAGPGVTSGHAGRGAPPARIRDGACPGRDGGPVPAPRAADRVERQSRAHARLLPRRLLPPRRRLLRRQPWARADERRGHGRADDAPGSGDGRAAIALGDAHRTDTRRSTTRPSSSRWACSSSRSARSSTHATHSSE